MKNIKYEGTVGSHVFQMVDDNTIEIWGSNDLEFPEGYIYLKEGDVKDEKSFQQEISFWFLQNS